MNKGLDKWRSVAMAVIVLLLPCQASLAQTRPISPEQAVREFYNWYLRAGLPSPKRKNLSTFRKYATQSLIKKQMNPEADADLFLGDIQDFDKTWKVDSVSKATIQGQRATTLVILKGKEWDYKFRVTLRLENGAWKIDDVKNALASTNAR